MREAPIGWAKILLPDGPEHLATNIDQGRWYEQELLEKVRSLIHDNAKFLDVGAHLGNHTLYFATECHAQHVTAIEPHPATFRMLKATVALNHLGKTVTPINALVHPEWETASADFQEDPEHPDIRSMLPIITEGGPIKCLTLDEAIGDGVDVIKIDVESAGPVVLGSGIWAIGDCKPIIIIEADSLAEQQAVDDLLLPLGYRNLGDYQGATATFIWTPDA